MSHGESSTGGVQRIETREDAERFLDERIGHGVKPGLERITGLLEFMGDPHKDYPSIHVAGTNGKTTISRMIQQILGSHGLAAGGFTSPHLHSVEERFTIHGIPVGAQDFIDAVAGNAWFVQAFEEREGTTVTYFEVTAALAFSIFATAAVDVAVVEVGLGGRLDATNVLDAELALITGIDIDHTEFLGKTIAEIAPGKAAIVGEGRILVSGPLGEEAEVAVAARVEEVGANWIRSDVDFSVTGADIAVGGWQCSIDGVFGTYEDLYLPMHGRHQVDHLASAIAASEMFLGRELDHDSLLVAVGSMDSPGRIEVVDHRPLVVLDGAHNEQGFRGLATALDTEFPAMPWQLVLGVRGERDIAKLVAPMKGLVAGVFATQAEDEGSIPASEVAVAAAGALGVTVEVGDSGKDALMRASAAAGPDGGVVVAGSLYLVGELRDGYDSLPNRAADAHLRFEADRELVPEHDLEADPTD